MHLTKISKLILITISYNFEVQSLHAQYFIVYISCKCKKIMKIDWRFQSNSSIETMVLYEGVIGPHNVIGKH